MRWCGTAGHRRGCAAAIGIGRGHRVDRCRSSMSAGGRSRELVRERKDAAFGSTGKIVNPTTKVSVRIRATGQGNPPVDRSIVFTTARKARSELNPRPNTRLALDLAHKLKRALWMIEPWVLSCEDKNPPTVLSGALRSVRFSDFADSQPISRPPLGPRRMLLADTSPCRIPSRNAFRCTTVRFQSYQSNLRM